MPITNARPRGIGGVAMRCQKQQPLPWASPAHLPSSAPGSPGTATCCAPLPTRALSWAHPRPSHDRRGQTGVGPAHLSPRCGSNICQGAPGAAGRAGPARGCGNPAGVLFAQHLLPITAQGYNTELFNKYLNFASLLIYFFKRTNSKFCWVFY